MSNPVEPLRFKVPPQDLEVLSFCEPHPKKLQAWVDALPKLNVGESAKSLYAAVQELNRLKQSADMHFAMLETIRSAIYYICANLEKHFLGKSVVLPERESRVANLTQALNAHLAAGYKSVAINLTTRSRGLDKESKALLHKALHRALSEQNVLLLRTFQLYHKAPPNFWRELHMMYLMADRHGLLERPHTDPEDDMWEASIRDLYIRALLLSTAKPSQLRQQQVQLVYEGIKRWTHYADISSTRQASGLFAIDLMRDFPPVYHSLMRQPSLQENVRYFDASALSSNLRELLLLPSGEKHPVPGFNVPDKFPNELSRVLFQAWGIPTERAFTRLEEHGSLEVCVGLSATHYFLSGCIDFSRLMAGRNVPIDLELSNPFLNSNLGVPRDAYGNGVQAIDTSNLGSSDEPLKPDEKERYPRFQCEIINTSPGGFCLGWSRDVPQQVKTGEIVGVLEADKSQWSVGVIRWVTHTRESGVRMGVELIAPTAIACGAQAVQKKGGVTEYMRSLILPQLQAIGQPATLITPNISFHEQQKVNLNQAGKVSRCQLQQQVAATPSFTQFQYRDLDMPEQESAPPTAKSIKDLKDLDDDFESIWSSL